MTDSAAGEAANKAPVLKVLTELFEDRDISALDGYYTDSLIQHNPRVPDGTDELGARVTANPNLHHQAGMVAADGGHRDGARALRESWGPGPWSESTSTASRTALSPSTGMCPIALIDRKAP